MNFETLIVEKEDNIALITLNRPSQLNALNKQLLEELHNALKELEVDEAVRVLIITGSGEKSFVAGADIKEFSAFGINEGTELAASGQKMVFDKLENFSKPIIAAINGFALGGGLELAMACHIRIASGNARMGLPETSLGLIPGYGGTQRLAQLIGRGRAMEMIFSAQMISAEKAEQWGLINSMATADSLIDECKALAQKIIKNSPQAIKSAIRSINAGFKEGIGGYNVEVEEFGKCFGTEDFKEGTTAFLEKRKPVF